LRFLFGDWSSSFPCCDDGDAGDDDGDAGEDDGDAGEDDGDAGDDDGDAGDDDDDAGDDDDDVAFPLASKCGAPMTGGSGGVDSVVKLPRGA